MKGKVFTAQEVQAILKGSKVMFREVIKFSELEKKIMCKADEPYLAELIKCPYQVGQKIFCKESFRIFDKFDCWDLKGASCKCSNHLVDGLPIYAADQNCFETYWKPAQHMKQEHSRLTLRITGIKVERLADISEEDAIAEGFKNTFVGFQHPVYNPGRTANQDFEIFWNATHKKPKEKFEADPWVWVVSFEAINN